MFESFRPSLRVCEELNDKLYAIKSVCNVDKESWKLFKSNRCSDIKDNNVQELFKKYGNDLFYLLCSVQNDIELLKKIPILSNVDIVLPSTSCIDSWKSHITSGTCKSDELYHYIQSIEPKVLDWYKILSEREDSGDTSSYSDYSASSSETESEEEECGTDEED